MAGPQQRKGASGRPALWLCLAVDVGVLLGLYLATGDRYEGDRLTYYSESFTHYSFTGSLADIPVIAILRCLFVLSLDLHLTEVVKAEGRDPETAPADVPVIAWHMSSVLFGLLCVGLSVAKLAVCMRLGLGRCLPWTSPHLALGLLGTFVALSGLQLLLGLLLVGHFRLRRKEAQLARYQTQGDEDAERQELLPEKSQRPKPKKANLSRLAGLAKPELPLLVPGCVCLLAANIASLAGPAYFGRVVDSVSTQHSREELTRNALTLLLVFALGAVATFARGFLFDLAGQRLVARIRKDVFNSIVRQDISFFDKNRTGELLNRLASDSQVLQTAVTSNFSMLARYVVQIIGAIGIMFYYSWKLTSVMLSVVPVVAIGAVMYGRFVRTLRKSFQDVLADAANAAEESLASIRTVRSFANEQRAMRQYALKIDRSYHFGRITSLAYGGFAGGVGLLAQSAIVLVLWYGGTLVLSGKLSPGTLTTFMLYTLTTAMAFAFLSSLYGDMMQAVGASERIFELMDLFPDIEPMPGRPNSYCTLGRVAGDVVFEDVCFHYPTRPDVEVLRNVSFAAQKGKVTALVGPSGGGKSTIVGLIERFYNPTSGRVLLDGQDVSGLDPRWLRRQMALVGQEPVLFACTVGENIAYGREGATEEEIINAAKQANAHDFIMSFPEGYATAVGERGVRLSGGQKQRIAIARALLMNPAILLLDEATSALDAESEHLVQEAIDRILDGRTVLVIAHRLSTVRHADQVIVIDGGCVVEKGTHDELVALGGTYKKLVQRQLQGYHDEH